MLARSSGHGSTSEYQLNRVFCADSGWLRGSHGWTWEKDITPSSLLPNYACLVSNYSSFILGSIRLSGFCSAKSHGSLATQPHTLPCRNNTVHSDSLSHVDFHPSICQPTPTLGSYSCIWIRLWVFGGTIGYSRGILGDYCAEEASCI
jgi:hypothetical protein